MQPDAAPSACTDDRFGPSLPDLPAADLDPGTFSDLVLCADQTDWFALAAGPGFPVTVRASGEAPLRLVMADGAGVVLAEDVGAAPRWACSSRCSHRRRRRLAPHARTLCVVVGSRVMGASGTARWARRHSS